MGRHAGLRRARWSIWTAVLAAPAALFAAEGASPERPQVAGVPVNFVLFGLTLLGVALFHHKTLQVAGV